MLPFDRLDQIVSRFQFLEAKLNEELSGADIAKISREYAELRPVVDEINEYKALLSALEEAEELLSDPDMKALLEDEVSNLKEKRDIVFHRKSEIPAKTPFKVSQKLNGLERFFESQR